MLEASGGRGAWRLFSAFWGMMAYYLCGMVYFYVISNYVIHMPVSWKLVVINCFLITAAEDFILCVMAAVVARRLMPFALGSIDRKWIFMKIKSRMLPGRNEYGRREGLTERPLNGLPCAPCSLTI